MSTQTVAPTAAPRPAKRKPPLLIKNDTLRQAKRRVALLTLVLPILGSIVAIASAIVTGVGWIEVALFGVMFAWVTIGLEVGFHRLFAHNAFKTSKPVEAFLWISALMSGQGRGLYWMATHRRHHAHSDTPGDPHSPFYRIGDDGETKLSGLSGFWHAHQGNTYTDYPTNVSLFAADVKRNAMYTKLDKQFPLWVAFGLAFPAVVGGLAYGSWVGAWTCFLWGGPLRMFIQHQCYFTNGSFGHLVGEQPFATKDNSRNNWWCAVWTFGSALQNTHHAFPNSAYLKYRWYELDVAGATIKLLVKLGLAHSPRFPSADAIAAKRTGAVSAEPATSAGGE